MIYISNDKTKIVSFTIKKIITCIDEESARTIEQNMMQLANASFGDIKIPVFSFGRNQTNVWYISDYVKGKILKKKEMGVVYENVVKRSPLFTLTNFSHENYIRCQNTGLIYYIDLNDCGDMAHLEREDLFERYNA
jgi:hypothetical protein